MEPGGGPRRGAHMSEYGIFSARSARLSVKSFVMARHRRTAALFYGFSWLLARDLTARYTPGGKCTVFCRFMRAPSIVFLYKDLACSLDVRVG